MSLQLRRAFGHLRRQTKILRSLKKISCGRRLSAGQDVLFMRKLLDLYIHRFGMRDVLSLLGIGARVFGAEP